TPVRTGPVAGPQEGGGGEVGDEEERGRGDVTRSEPGGYAGGRTAGRRREPDGRKRERGGQRGAGSAPVGRGLGTRAGGRTCTPGGTNRSSRSRCAVTSGITPWGRKKMHRTRTTP